MPIERILPDGRTIQVLRSSKPKSLLYDITHDNPGPMEQWNPHALLPVVCALAMANEPVGTTRGMDEFIPKNVSVVSERRPYRILPDVDVPDLAEIKGPVGTNVEIVFNGEYTKVAVAGSFNNWNGSMNLLEQVGPGTWKTTLHLFPGRYHYKFLVNDKDWVLGPYPTERDGVFANNVINIEDKSLGGLKVFEDIRAVRKTMNELHAILGKHRTTLSTYNMVFNLSMVTLLGRRDCGQTSA